MIAPCRDNRASSGGADTAILPRRADGLVENLARAGSGDPNAMQRMNEAMQRATLRDARHHRPLDLERAQARYEALRAAERALVAVNEYAAKRSTPTPEPVQTPATHANRFARFFSDGERPKPDACKAAKGIWGRARRGVI